MTFESAGEILDPRITELSKIMAGITEYNRSSIEDLTPDSPIRDCDLLFEPDDHTVLAGDAKVYQEALTLFQAKMLQDLGIELPDEPDFSFNPFAESFRYPDYVVHVVDTNTIEHGNRFFVVKVSVLDDDEHEPQILEFSVVNTSERAEILKRYRFIDARYYLKTELGEISGSDLDQWTLADYEILMNFAKYLYDVRNFPEYYNSGRLNTILETLMQSTSAEILRRIGYALIIAYLNMPTEG